MIKNRTFSEEGTPEPAAADPLPAETRLVRRDRPKKGKNRLKRFVPYLMGAAVIWILFTALRPRPLLVEAGTVSRGPLVVSISEEGKTRVKNRYVMVAPTAGQLRRVTLKPGAPIEKDRTVLAEIEAGMSTFLDPRSRIQAEAAVRSAEAAQARAAAELERARTSLGFAKNNWDRISTLYKRGGVSIEARDAAEREFNVLSEDLRAVESGLKMATSELEQRRAALLDAGERGAGEADAPAIVRVLAPVDGAILRVLQESATPIVPGTPILEVGNPRELEIEIDVLSRDAVSIKPGAEVLLEEWGGDRPLPARVRLVEPSAYTKISALGVEEQRTNIIADFVDPLPEDLPISDLFRVDARIVVWRREDVVRIPAGALFRRGGKWMTFVIEGGKARTRELEAGHSDGVLTEVLSGIEPGARVLVHPSDKVTDGVRIRPRD